MLIRNAGVKVSCVKQQFNYIVNIDIIVKIYFNIADSIKRNAFAALLNYTKTFI